MSIAKSVEYIELTLSGTTVSGMLTEGQNIDNCVPYSCCGTMFPVIADASVSDNGYLVIEKDDFVSNNTIMHSFVVEYDSEIIGVQRGEFYVDIVSGTIDINSVDPYKSYIVHYYIREPNSSDVGFNITNSGTLSWVRPDESGYASGHYYVITSLSGSTQPPYSFSTTLDGVCFELEEDVFYNIVF